MARQTTQDRINSGINFEIHSIMFLYSKEEWIIVVSTRLQKIEPIYDKG